MANARIRLTPSTIELLTNLGQHCGVDDLDTLIKLLIRKYGDQLVNLLAPSNPNRDSLTQVNPVINESTPKATTSDPNQDILTTIQPSNNSKPSTKARPPIEGL